MAGDPQERRRLGVAQAWATSPKRFDGWSPSFETVYEYDGDRLIRSITRQLEPEWDDLTRSRVEGLARFEDESCPGCGLHASILADPEHNHFTFEERLCKVCASTATYGRVLASRDELVRKSLGEDAPPTEPRPDDGRHLYLRPLTAAELAAKQAKKKGGD